MKKIILLLLIFSSVMPSFAQQNEAYLKQYIRSAIQNNLELQSARATLNTYDAKSDQAFSAWLPKVALTSRYTRAGGGRTFDFPMGMMIEKAVKPGYVDKAVAEQLNITTSFMRPEEQDSKIELVQPIFNMPIYYANKAADAQKQAADFEYQRKEIDITYQVKEAYYNYIKTLQLMDIRKSAIELANENKRVVQNLFDVDKAPKSDILRTEVLLSNMKQELQASESMSKMSRNFFNNIINTEFSNEVKYDAVTLNDLTKPENKEYLQAGMSLEEATAQAMNSRPELKQMELTLEALRQSKNIITADNYPSLSLVADYGIQGEKYQFDDQSRYWMVSGVLSWNLFSGFETRAKADEMEYQIEAITKSMESIRQMIKLDVENNFIEYTNNMEQLAVAETTFLSAEENYRMNKRRYEEGLNPLINLIDAQTTLTGARSNYVVTYYNILTSKARLEKSIGSNVNRLTTDNNN